MSWLRSSPLRQSFSRSGSSAGGSRGSGSNGTTGVRATFDASECDPKACYDSFCIHWQQAYEIIQRSEVRIILWFCVLNCEKLTTIQDSGPQPNERREQFH